MRKSIATAREPLSLTTVLDLVERLVVAVLFGFFAYRMISSYLVTGALTNLLLVASETLVIVFMIIRRFARIVSLSPIDWALAFGATIVPLFATPGSVAALTPGTVSIFLAIGGFLVQLSAKLVLRRKFGVVAANRGIVVSGPYKFVRHPMYLGYFLTGIGFFLANPSIWNLVVYATSWSLQAARLLAEERLLGEDPEYRAFMGLVRWRVIPGLF